MNILIVEPYLTGSHQAWAEGYQAASRHTVKILGLKGQFWKWRMHGGAVTLARRFLESDFQPDLIIATDMLDLTTFLSLTRERTSETTIVMYFHENQLAYPWSPDDRDLAHKRDHHYGFINYASALSADHLFFNSNYNRDSFLNALPGFLKHFPDHRELETVQMLRLKSSVLHLGIDLRRLDKYTSSNAKENKVPVVLWNHRWEHDKNPRDFFRILERLKNQGRDFKLIILGENFRKKPAEFDRARRTFDILQFGFVDSVNAYARWLWRADILPVTSHHDFFGISVVEAIYCKCLPLLPNRLAYPELVPEQLYETCLYTSTEELAERLDSLFDSDALHITNRAREYVCRFDWHDMAPEYDTVFQTTVK